MRIGILTYYYGSKNYGGVLQAYALVSFLTKMGYECEQICFDTRYNSDKLYPVKHFYCWLRDEYFRNFGNYIKHPLYFCKEKKRTTIFKSFCSNDITHSSMVYNSKNIIRSNDIYDCFIVGSDQVWSEPSEAFLLKFVHNNKIKLSYAASIGNSNLDDNKVKRFNECLQHFQAVSVREYDLVDLLQPYCKEPIQWVVDPVFLLGDSEWRAFSSKELISEKYLLCYFLGNDVEVREKAREYAQSNGLKIVNLPCLQHKLEINDMGFPDYNLFKVTPNDFVSLVLHAEVVFTDSFHATAFSLIFHKRFVVFSRVGNEKMNVRITSILSLFNESARFCNANIDKDVLSFILREETRYTEAFEKLKANSAAFLRRSINSNEQ